MTVRRPMRKEKRDKAGKQKRKAGDELWGKERHGKARQPLGCKQELGSEGMKGIHMRRETNSACV